MKKKLFLMPLFSIMWHIAIFAQQADPYAWPIEILSGQDTVIVYLPQTENWQDNQLHSRSAVQLLSPGKDAIFGIVEFTSRTETELQQNLLLLSDVKIQKCNFPTLPDKGKSLSKLIAQHLDQAQLSLEQVKSDLSINKAVAGKKQDVKNDPPQIIFSTSPAALVLIDGGPSMAKMQGTSWERVINTSFFLVFDPERRIYELGLFGEWFTSNNLSSAWTPDPSPDPQLDQMLQEALQSDTSIQTFNPPPQEISGIMSQGEAPQIFVSTVPAELIISDGEPMYEPIPNTNILYVKNTSADIFKYVEDGMTYLLISGRWFRAADVHQTWTFVPPDKLPQDFSEIPENHSKGSALVSVAGTPQAEEAAVANQIPQTATVTRQGDPYNVNYDGSPEFQPVQGTNLQYAVNSPTPVVMADGSYYAVSNGIWYNAQYPAGPWVVAVSIPPVIYTIPPSSPLHYVTYVRVFGYTPTVVYTGYYPGYYGCYLNPYGTVVYGTGWWYRPWVGRRWFGNPYTYGVGVSFNWNNWAGWSMSFGFGTRYYPAARPWWGPMAYGPHRWGYINHSRVNIYNGSRRNVIVNNNFYRNSRGNFNGRNRGDTRQTNVRNDRSSVYAGRDGNVYRRDNNGGWQMNRGNQWQNSPSSTSQQMNNQQGGRNRAVWRDQTQQRMATNNNERSNIFSRPSSNSNFNRAGMERSFGGFNNNRGGRQPASGGGSRGMSGGGGGRGAAGGGGRRR